MGGFFVAAFCHTSPPSLTIWEHRGAAWGQHVRICDIALVRDRASLESAALFSMVISRRIHTFSPLR
jgi:hypothetical protein